MNYRHCALFIVAFCVCIGLSSAVIGIDFGSKWIKMSVIRGNEFSVILDAASQRKITNTISFSDGERFFGADAERLITKNPSTAYVYTSQLLGKVHGHQFVSDTAHHFPYYSTLVADDSRGTYAIRYDDKTVFNVEDLAAMILNYARTTAEAFLKTKVRDCVITVPPFFGTEERAAVIEIARLANLNVLSLVNDGTAVALHYAFGRKFEENPQLVVFYDMGHSSTRATVVEFRSLVTNKGKKNSTVPQLKVRSVGWDATLGGREFTYRLAQHLSKLATEQLKQKFPSMAEDLSQNPKAMARLTVAAEKAKTVLSANQETTVSVESLVGDFDFKMMLTREQFEEWCQDLFARVAEPVLQALRADELTMANITAVELVGGGVRVPRVQSVLREALGIEELQKHLNGDEAAVLGAVFYGAQMSTTMRVPEYKVKDISFFPVRALLNIPDHVAEASEAGEPQVEVATSEDEEEVQIQGKEIVLTLFKGATRLGARKNLNFHTAKADNFTVELSFENPQYLPASTPDKIAFYTITGVEKTRAHNYTGKPKIGLGFRLTTSGLIELEKAEAEITVVKWPEPEVEKIVESDSDDDDDLDKKEKTTEGTKSDEEQKDASSQDAASEEKAAEAETEGKEGDAKSEDSKTEEQEKEKDSKDDKAKDKKDKKDKKKAKKEKKVEAKKGPKKYVHRIPLQVEGVKLGIPEFDSAHVAKARKAMDDWDNADLVKKETAEAKNDLETYIYATKDKLDDSSLEAVSTEAQREEAREALTNAGEWLYDEGDAVSVKEYKDKLKELKKLSDPIFFRAEEATKRPEAVSRALNLINTTRTLGVNITKILMVEEYEMEEILESCNELEQWLLKKIEEQDALSPTEEPVLKSETIYRRGAPIEKKLQSIVKRKARPPPPPPTPASNNNTDTNTTTTTTTTTEGGTATQQQETTTTTTEEGQQQQAATEDAAEKEQQHEEEQQQETLNEEKETIPVS